MRRNLAPRVVLAQALLYSAGVLVCLSLILWGNASNARMQARNERLQKEHERIMLLLDDTLRERARAWHQPPPAP